jgi:hypothetical protein
MSNASFSSLFRRGRYVRAELHEGENNDGEEKQRQNRLELFTVAAVAFTIKHDSEFKRHFLKMICDVPDPTNVDDYVILLQPYDFDMVLCDDKTSEVIVIEFKVNAGLEKKQDFSNGNEDKFSNPPEGYGHQIETKYSRYKNLKYVVLQKNDRRKPSESPVQRRKVLCFSRVWSNLLYDGKESPLAKDLMDWLAQEIPEMKSRIYKNMKMKKAEDIQKAAETYDLLCSVATDHLKDKKPIFDISTGNEGSFFGANIRKDCDGFDGLKKYFKVASYLGWFGYGQRQGEAPSLEIWIYTGWVSNEIESVKKLSDLISPQLGIIASVKVDKPSNNIVILCADSTVSDLDWFGDVIEKLKAVKPPPSSLAAAG